MAVEDRDDPLPPPIPIVYANRRAVDPRLVKVEQRAERVEKKTEDLDHVADLLGEHVGRVEKDTSRLWQAIGTVCLIFMAGVVAAVWFTSLPTKNEIKELRAELKTLIYGPTPNEPGLLEQVRKLQREVEALKAPPPTPEPPHRRR